jgi:hypothetical protein
VVDVRAQMQVGYCCHLAVLVGDVQATEG